jgi:murein DD-endopeptidase MepM/ murein hydrolase activator NlpD
MAWRLVRLVSFLFFGLVGLDEASAQKGRGGGAFSSTPTSEEEGGLSPEDLAAFAPQRATVEGMELSGLIATGLAAKPPQGLACPVVTSAFGVTTRGDGSSRSQQFFHGRHGGIDIPTPEGTPVLAMAAGTVVTKGVGGSIGGIGIVLRHAPEDTGLAIWVFTEYKHLREEPALEIGNRVEMGAVVAFSGKTGTQGRHYGPDGHPHLHLSAFWNVSGEFQARRVLAPLDGHWLDPLALFRSPPYESAQLAALPAAAKITPIAVQTVSGRRIPATTKVIWPLACSD